MKQGDEHKAVFITNEGLFELLVIFLVWLILLATFQKIMNDIFRKLILTNHVIIYINDILIFTDDLATHRILTRQVLKILNDNNLCKPKKCMFEVPVADYLGVVVSRSTLRVNQKKV